MLTATMTAALAVLLASGCANAPAAGSPAAAANPTDEAIVLFDGTSLAGWEHVGPGRFVLERDGSMRTEGGMGLLYYAERPFRDFVLELEYRTASQTANSGVFVRFPERPADPWEAVHAGYEIQIDDSEEPIRMTGSIYTFSAPFRLASRRPGEWNEYRIEVSGQRYQVYLNGEKVNDYFGSRGREGYIGVQNLNDASVVHFRNIRVTPLEVVAAPERLGDLFSVAEQRAPIRVLMITATTGWRHEDAIETSREVMAEVARTTELVVDFTEDIATFTPANLARYDLLFFANSTLRVAEPDAGEDPEPDDYRAENPAPLLSAAQRRAIREFAASPGKGIVVAHGGIAALYGWREFREMVGGGLFREHPWVHPVRISVEQPADPAVRHFGESFWLRDEIYVLDRNPRPASRVLLSLDVESVDVTLAPSGTNEHDYPISWKRGYGAGRVFVTTLGHFPDVWHTPAYLRHLLEGMRWAAARSAD